MFEIVYYFGRHWRGEQPLWRAFWVNGFLGWLIVSYSTLQMNNVGLGWIGVAVWAACMFILWRGVWISARVAKAEGKKLAGLAAQGFIVLAVMQALNNIGRNLLGPWLLGTQ